LYLSATIEDSGVIRAKKCVSEGKMRFFYLRSQFYLLKLVFRKTCRRNPILVETQRRKNGSKEEGQETRDEKESRAEEDGRQEKNYD